MIGGEFSRGPEPFQNRFRTAPLFLGWFYTKVFTGGVQEAQGWRRLQTAVTRSDAASVPTTGLDRNPGHAGRLCLWVSAHQAACRTEARRAEAAARLPAFSLPEIKQQKKKKERRRRQKKKKNIYLHT